MAVESIFGDPQRDTVCLAQSPGRFDERVEHRLQVESRAANDLEHVGSGGLLLKRFAQLVEQPRVLDGDDGLRGEVCDQLDLLVGERAHLLPVDADCADQLVLLEHGDNHGPRAGEGGDSCVLPRPGVAWE